MLKPGLALFAEPLQLKPGAAPPSRYRVTLAAMRTELWILLGAWLAAGAVLAMLGFWKIGVASSVVGIAADLGFQARLRALARKPDPVGGRDHGLGALAPIVAARFTLGVLGPLAVLWLEHTPANMAVVLLLQAWSICVALAQFSALPRLFMIAIAPPLTAVVAALWPYFRGDAGPALVGSLGLLVAILALIGRQVGSVWSAWAEAWSDNAALVEALKASRSAADAASQAKSVFLATMSHEVRTPLNGILGMAQLMDLNPLEDAQKERIAIIRRSGESLMGTLNAVLDLSRIEAGRLELTDGVFEPAGLVRDSVAAFAASAALKRLNLEVEIDASAAGSYRGDGLRLRQVLDNLVGNAIKFTDRGNISLSVKEANEGLVFEVRDTGPGIPRGDLQRIFRPFEQSDGSYRRAHEGSGLGLSICSKLTALMGGTIIAESELGAGTCFRVCLPATREAVSHEAPARSAENLEPVSFTALVADDNGTNRTVLTALLEHLGGRVEGVEDGAAAVSRLAEQAFDLVLMDVQMPVMDGLAATRALRTGAAGPDAAGGVIIGVTGNAMSHQVEECYAAGMDQVVTKPIELSALVSAIEAGLASRHERAAIDGHAPIPSTATNRNPG